MSESSHGTAQVPNESGDSSAVDVAGLRASPEFVRVRRRARTFTFLVGALVIAWFMVLLWLSGYQRELLSVRLWERLSLGMVFVWSQVVTSVVVAVLFVRHSRTLDAEISSLGARQQGAGS